MNRTNLKMTWKVSESNKQMWKPWNVKNVLSCACSARVRCTFGWKGNGLFNERSLSEHDSNFCLILNDMLYCGINEFIRCCLDFACILYISKYPAWCLVVPESQCHPGRCSVRRWCVTQCFVDETLLLACCWWQSLYGWLWQNCSVTSRLIRFFRI